MPVSLAEMASRLQEDVSARNSVPNAAQYPQAVKDAVLEYAALLGRRKTGTLEIIAGTAAYVLPDDYLGGFTMAPLPGARDGSVFIAAAGIIPVSRDFEETPTAEAGMLTISPTPQYAAERTYRYTAGFVLADGYYAALTEADARLVMLKAQSLALQLQATQATRESFSYALGDERVGKEKLAASIQEQADKLNQQFLAAVKGPGTKGTGSRARYDLFGGIVI